MIGDYIIQNHLGEGTFGTVKLATHKITGEKVAIKIQSYTNTKREYDFLANLHHPNIVKVLSRVMEVPFQFRSKLSHESAIVMEYVEGGDLVRVGKVKQETAMKFLMQILSALSYCHKKNITHRDIKADNILYNSKTETLMLADFGLASYIMPNRYFTDRAGSLVYCAPEVLASAPHKGPEADIWSTGVVFYGMLTGHLPWAGFTQEEQIQNAKLGKYYKVSYLSPECEQILASMFSVTPSLRPTADQLLDTLRRILSPSPLSSQSSESSMEMEGEDSDVSDPCSDSEDDMKLPIAEYHLRCINFKELKCSLLQRLVQYVQPAVLSEELESSLEGHHIRFEMVNKTDKKNQACHRYSCTFRKSRFDIELCTIEYKPNSIKAVICKMLEGDPSEVKSLVTQVFNKCSFL
mmetsp:Transcript_26102/g.36742  ORF Transcript_26102/g.36742 Transcript_26102/m.36742 type:complete len:408 (+) Transcript_26102:70-1293(+)